MTLSEFFHNQMATWPETAARYADLARVEVRDFGAVSAQYNPARMVSTGAKVDKKTLAQRPCFLCKDHRPEIQQEWAFGEDFDVLVNPFPILPTHFTIAARRHRPQTILDTYATLYELADRFEGTLFFYNGPKCGASAPDHLHFQGGDGSVVPLCRDWRGWRERLREVARLDADNRLCTIEDYPFPTLVLISNDKTLAQTLFRRAYAALPCHPDDTEPMLNVLAWREEDSVVTILLPREKHRPACYTASCEADRMLISPGALDMAGLVITPRKEDFDRLTPSLLVKTVGEVALGQEAFAKVLRRLQEPRVAVGITSGPEVAFVLEGSFMVDGTLQTGPQTVRAKDGRILWPAVFVHAARGHDRHRIPLGAQGGADLRGDAAAGGRRRPGVGDQRTARGALSRQRHLKRDAGHLVAIAPAGPCHHLPQLAPDADGASHQCGPSLGGDLWRMGDGGGTGALVRPRRPPALRRMRR